MESSPVDGANLAEDADRVFPGGHQDVRRAPQLGASELILVGVEVGAGFLFRHVIRAEATVEVLPEHRLDHRLPKRSVRPGVGVETPDRRFFAEELEAGHAEGVLLELPGKSQPVPDGRGKGADAVFQLADGDAAFTDLGVKLASAGVLPSGVPRFPGGGGRVFRLRPGGIPRDEGQRRP